MSEPLVKLNLSQQEIKILINALEDANRPSSDEAYSLAMEALLDRLYAHEIEPDLRGHQHRWRTYQHGGGDAGDAQFNFRLCYRCGELDYAKVTQPRGKDA